MHGVKYTDPVSPASFSGAQSDDVIKLQLEINALKAEAIDREDEKEQIESAVNARVAEIIAGREDEIFQLKKSFAEEQKASIFWYGMVW